MKEEGNRTHPGTTSLTSSSGGAPCECISSKRDMMLSMLGSLFSYSCAPPTREQFNGTRAQAERERERERGDEDRDKNKDKQNKHAQAKQTQMVNEDGNNTSHDIAGEGREHRSKSSAGKVAARIARDPPGECCCCFFPARRGTRKEGATKERTGRAVSRTSSAARREISLR